MKRSPPSSVQPLADSIAAVAFLQATTLCKDLPEAVMSLLYEKSELVDYGPSDVIIAQDDSEDSDLFIVFEGDVAILKRVDGSWLHIADLERPAVFGEISALTEQPRSAAVVAVTKCHLVRIPGAEARAVAEVAPKFGKRLAMLMSARDKDLDRKTSG